MHILTGTTARACLASFLLFAVAGCVPTEDDGTGKRIARLSASYEHAQANSPAPESPLTLEAAIRYALLHNLSIRESEIEFAIQHETKSGQYLRMLPSLNVRGAFDSRSKYDASSSQTINGSRRNSYSTSDDKTHSTADISVVWSLLDFGMHYIRALQNDEKVRISQEQLRRVRQQVAMDTAIAYYRAAAAEDTMRRCASLPRAIEIQLGVIEQEAQMRNISTIEKSKRSLPFLNGLRRIEEIRGEAASAKAQLAKAMGAPRPRDIQLAKNATDMLATHLPDDVDALVALALAKRPEMMAEDSRVRISEAEAKATLLQIAPNVSLSAGYSHDDNSFLLYEDWLTAGISMTWNLLSIPSRVKEHGASKQRVELERHKELVTAASIVMQVHLAAIDLAASARRLAMAERIEATHGDLIRAMAQTIRDGKANEGEVLLERVRYLSEYASFSRARAEHLSARARLAAAVGIDPCPDDLEPLDASALAITAKELSP